MLVFGKKESPEPPHYVECGTQYVGFGVNRE